MPRCSSRLAKKSKSRLLAVAAAQNVLIKKMGEHVEADDFERYIIAFKEGLTDAQVQMIHKLFACHMPPSDGDALVEEAA
jgi:hypothetical protein